MGRQVRRVPPWWHHPTDEQGHHIPLLNESYADAAQQWYEGAAQWARGYRDDYDGGWKPKDPDMTYSYEEWAGQAPDVFAYMPYFPPEICTHWQMYEDTTEGTPISPVMETPEALAEWLATHKASASGDMTATYDQWLAMIRQGCAPSGIWSPQTGMISGVAAAEGRLNDTRP